MKRLFILCILLFFCFSCEDSNPTLGTVRHMVLYDYNDNRLVPLEKLAIYVELQADPMRIESLSIESLDTGYVWIIDNPQYVNSNDNDNDKVWIGSSNILPSRQFLLPRGSYIARYTDVAQRNAEIAFSIDTLVTASDIQEDEYTRKNIAIYDDNDNLLYFGSSVSLDSDEEILEKFNSASFTRTILMDQRLESAILKPVHRINRGE